MAPSALSISAKPFTGGTLVRLAGVIDEQFDRRRFLEATKGNVLIDFGGVRRITSFGVREWAAVVAQVPACWFVNCRPIVIFQLNLVPNFAGAGQIVTFYAPYRCSLCNQEFEQLFDLRHDLDLLRDRLAKSSFPEFKCPTCNVPADFDDLPKMYFSFLDGRGPPTVPAMAQAILDVELETLGSLHPPSTPAIESLKDARHKASEVQERVDKLIKSPKQKP